MFPGGWGRRALWKVCGGTWLGACRVLGALELKHSFADLLLRGGFSHGRTNGEPDVRGFVRQIASWQLCI